MLKFMVRDLGDDWGDRDAAGDTGFVQSLDRSQALARLGSARLEGSGDLRV
jgi:hypothetical protein